MNKVKLSIITVVYNDVVNIEKTITDTLQQTYSNIEYVIVDGASTDGTTDIIKKYDKNVKWISEPDNGVYDAMMKGARMATGEWLLFHNSGDYFINETCIEDVFEQYEDQGEDFIACNTRFMRHQYYRDAQPAILTSSYLSAMPFFHPSTFVRRETQLKYPFNLKYKNSADYDFFVKSMINGATYKYIDVIVAVFDSGSGISVAYGDRRRNENIDILSSYDAPQKYIEERQNSLKKWKRNQRYCRFFLYRCLYEWNFIRSGKWKRIK